ncbi:MAG: S8 family peptidase [Bacillota bacterium]
MAGKTHSGEKKAKLSKKLSLRLSAAATDEPLPVIVILKEGIGHDDQEVRERLAALGGKIHRELPLLGGFAALIPGGAITAIAAHPKIEALHLDRKARPCLDIGIPSVQGETASAAGHTGRGVTIAVVDSGIHPHPDFTRPVSRILGWYDAVAHRPEPYDDHGHGTHVAGIAAGNGHASGGKYRGVAPEAGIVAVKVVDADGAAMMSQVIEGLQWVLANREKYNIRVVNLSLGADPSGPYWNDPLCLAVEKLWRAGLVVAAAGNDGPQPGSIDTPGNDPLIITVGALDDRGTTARDDDTVPDFSSRGPTSDGIPKPELYAPGVRITAPSPPYGYAERTGTSMATPFVTGAAALLLAKEPDLAPNEVKRRLRAAAERSSSLCLRGGIRRLNVRRLLGLPEEKRGHALEDRGEAARDSGRVIWKKPSPAAVLFLALLMA